VRLVGGSARWLVFKVVTTQNQFDINVDKLLLNHGAPRAQLRITSKGVAQAALPRHAHRELGAGEHQPDTGPHGIIDYNRGLLPLREHVEFYPVRGTGSARHRSGPRPLASGETEGISVSARISVERIIIELEIPGDSRSLFRLRLDNKVVGENLTAVQTHLLVGEILDRITLPRPADREREPE
jgi:hypothetical protein